MKTNTKKVDCKAIAAPPQNRAILSRMESRLQPVSVPALKVQGSEAESAKSRFCLSGFKVLGCLLCALCFLLFNFPSRSAIVYGNLLDLHLSALSTPLTWYPTNTVLISPGGLSAGPAFTVYPTNGAFTNVIDAGPYTVCMQLNTWRSCFHVDVPGGTNAYNITNLISPRILADDTGGALLADP